MNLEQKVSDLLCSVINNDNQADLKYLANRQLAPYRYGKGRVLFYDDCEHTSLLWASSLAGAGAVAISNTTAWQIEKSYRLYVTAAGADSAKLEKRISTMLGGFIGLDFYFAISEGEYSAFDSLDLGVIAHSYSQLITGKIRMKCTGNDVGWDLYYLDDAGNEVLLPFTIAVVSKNDYLTTFHHVKLVIDTKRNQYYYMMINNQFYDLRGKKMEIAADAGQPEVKALIELHGDAAGAAGYVYLDQLTITDKERLPDFPEEYEEFTEL